MKNLSIEYNFIFENSDNCDHSGNIDNCGNCGNCGNCKNKKNFLYQINIDEDTLTYRSKKDSGPEWTKLEYFKCANCPFTPNDHPFCPVALNLAELVDSFKTMYSYEKAKVYVKTAERVYCKYTDLQTGLLSAFGAIMACSGCPHCEIFRPLVRFHLPFASFEETIFRMVSMFIISEYFGSAGISTNSSTIKNDIDSSSISISAILRKLKEKYEKIEMVNAGMLERINKFVHTDANKNAFVGLNNFAQIFSIEYDSNFLDSLRMLFKHLKHTEK
ncbi:MAG: hypothetical protein HQK53_06845 [Oligoflexia bacterium]|nr:hypothetical protein [Oligoflexia bacterium]